MTEETEETPRALTLGNLLLMCAFVITVESLILELKQAGGGLLRYVIGVPLGLVTGALIVPWNYQLARFLWLRSQRFSKRAQDAAGLGILALHIVWIAVGAGLGFLLARLLIKFL
jgi:hypothetical protein